MKRKILLSFTVLSTLLLSQTFASQQDCNAHIDVSSEESQVSFEKMFLEVYSSSGAKQESSQCTPDGNCFIIVYNLDKFSLRMRGPQGSVFEPAEYVIDNTKGNQKCEDLAFKLKGFSLKYAVKSQTQDGKFVNGPSGLQVELRRQSKAAQGVLETQATNEQGLIEFKDISIPDVYQLSISSPELTFKTQNVNCVFKWEEGFKCDEDFFLISGFSITGQILSYNDPMPNVNVYLHSGDVKITEKSKNFLKNVVTDPQGKYQFTDIQLGSYQIVAVYSENQSKFQVEPEVIRVNVEGKSLTVQPFNVIGFSIQGRVLNSKNEGISGVKINIDGQQRAITNEKGVYKLDEITPGMYILEGFKDHYIFDALNINIQPNSRQIANLVASDYHLCGKVSIDTSSPDSKAFSVVKRTVTLQEKNKVERRTTTNENGEFCFEVKSGQYSLSAVITSEEREKGLRLQPSERQVTVDGAPVFNVNFGQSKLSINGKVKCLEQDDQKCQQIKVQLSIKDKVLANENVNEKGQFKFEKVLPGKYQLRINMDEFCWQQEKFDIDIQDDESRDYQFVQTGYAMPYESSHTLDLIIKKGLTGQVEKKRLDKSKNGKLCLEQRGSYTIIPDSCYRFEQDKFTFETSQAQNPLVFKPSHLKVEGRVQLKDEAQVSKVKMVVLDGKDNSKIEELKLKKTSDTSYTFEYYSPIEKSLVIEPQITDDANLLFYPQRKQITVGGDCVTNIVFESKTGYLVTGRVEPATEGVQIRVLNKKTMQEVAIVLTDKEGNYKVGPLYDDQSYEIEPSKEDYIFKREGDSNNFRAQKLSNLVVTIQDQNGQPLEQVALQLSAGKGFRLTGTTNSQGQFKFVGLNAGKFYLTAILKEYEFEQSSTLVELQDGDHAQKTLNAKRVSFSAFGQVSKINGLPLTQGRIVARCENCDRVEETRIESDGAFRIRGLIPNQKYFLTVVSDEIDRTVPAQIPLEVKSEDSRGHQFLAIMQSPFIEVSGSINFDGEDLKQVFREDPKAVVELYDSENPEQPLKTQQLGLSRYFQFGQLPRKQYLLKVVPKRGLSDTRYEPVIFKTSSQGGFQEISVPSKKKGNQNIQRSALLGPILFALLVLALLNKQKIQAWLGIEEQREQNLKQQQRTFPNPKKASRS